MKTETIWITPAIAKVMLAKNNLNRKLNRPTIDMYAEDMSAGRWKLVHQGLLIGGNDNIIDGQHRLHAVVKSGVPQHFLVSSDEAVTSARDLPIDLGLKRSASFVTGYPQTLVGTANLAVTFCTGASKISSSTTGEWCKYFYQAHAIFLQGNKTTLRGISCAPMFLAGCTRILMGDDPTWVRNTYANLVTSKFTELDPLPASFYKQIVVERTGLQPREYFSRAMRVLDSGRKELLRLAVKNEDSAFNEAREKLVAVCQPILA